MTTTQVTIGIDIGTTNSKVGVFGEDGRQLSVVSRPTETLRDEKLGIAYYDPERMWRTLYSALTEALTPLGDVAVASIGIASMAESGLVVERSTGAPRSPFLPWFDTCSEPQAALIREESDPFERFVASGLHGSFKLGLAKILWIRDHIPGALSGGDPVWLSASSWIAYRLTGRMAFDDSLAARTYAYRIDRREWDAPWVRHFDLPAGLFPESVPGGQPIGALLPELRAGGLTASTQVAIAGHDHVAAALAVGAIRPGEVYDSMGTAETLVGTLEARPLTRDDYEAGLSFGVHIAPGRYFWMGGQSSSGGSVEWLRELLGDPALSYEQLLALCDAARPGPTGVLYFPYLAGSGAPMPDSASRASFVGLAKSHGKADVLKAALEGTAYQLEMMKRSAERLAGGPIERLLVVGGGTRNPLWLSVKADITGCELMLPGVPEASLLGAALAAGIGAGVYADAEEAVAAASTGLAASGIEPRTIAPDAARAAAYRTLYERGFAPLQAPLRAFFAAAAAAR
ncbi:FGGY-family carbohydrate kinase [Paenibacillus sp.]|uniref:FGGY-family carbohydrate kinase n=1 Tax=Paenibacillus sp. TaxID=58172 RepID=UPI002D2268C4|nr:FGGY family carbohydrate kinase [Paenibacillus sp.]HZG57735.1 FGGY family carbohydrate kinase [Paenibacillus sp.]